MRKSLSVILLITCFASFASAMSIDHPNFVASTKKCIDFNLKSIAQAVTELNDRIPLPIATSDLALDRIVWNTPERRQVLDSIADDVSLIKKRVVGLISLDSSTFDTAVAGIRKERETLLAKCAALLAATPQTSGAAAASPLAATPPAHANPANQSAIKQRSVRIFYQQVDKKLRDELQVDLPPIGDLQKKSLETLECIHTILGELNKIKMPLADRELAQKNRQLAHELIRLFRDVLEFNDSEPVFDWNSKEHSMAAYYRAGEWEKIRGQDINSLLDKVEELRRRKRTYDSAKTQLMAAHLENFDKKLAVLLAQHRVNTSDVTPGGVSLLAGTSSAPVGKTLDQKALGDAQHALRENESSIGCLKQNVDSHRKEAVSRGKTYDEEIAEIENHTNLLISDQKKLAEDYSIAKDYFKEALVHYLKDSPYKSRYTHFLNLGKRRDSSFLSLPSDIIITPQFFVLLDILKMIKADQSSIYFAHPKFAQYLGIFRPSLEITFSEALAKWGLEKDLTIQLPDSSFGQYRGRTAIHLHNMMTLLKRHNHTDLANSLEPTIIHSAVPEPLLKMITDCFESECVGDVVAVHSMPAEMVFVTTITDIIRNRFGGCIKVSATPQVAASPGVAAAPLFDQPGGPMTCAGRGREEVFGKAENLDGILKMHIIDPRQRMLHIDNYGSINVQTPYGINMAVNMQELLLSVNMSLLGNMPIPHSFTLGYLANAFSLSPPTWQGTLDNTFKSMGLGLLSSQFKDLFRSFILKHSANSLFKIVLTQERADKIMYLCHVKGVGLSDDIENCRPHLLGFFRYVMQKANVDHSGWPVLKAEMAKIFKDPFHLQARISMIPDLFHNSPECQKTLTENSDIPFDAEPFTALLTRLLTPAAASAS